MPLTSIKEAAVKMNELAGKLQFNYSGRPIFQKLGDELSDLQETVTYLTTDASWKKHVAKPTENFKTILDAFQTLHDALQRVDTDKLKLLAKQGTPEEDKELLAFIAHIESIKEAAAMQKFADDKRQIQIALQPLTVPIDYARIIPVLEAEELRLKNNQHDDDDRRAYAAKAQELADARAAKASREKIIEDQWLALQELSKTLVSPTLAEAIKVDKIKATKKDPVQRRKGALKLAPRPGAKITETFVDDDRYSKIAGKESPQAIRIRNKVHEKDTNFSNFYSAVTTKINGLANPEIHGRRTPTRDADEIGYIKSDKVRAYANTKVHAEVVGKGTANEHVVVTVMGASGQEEIIRVKNDRLICASNLIPILEPAERAKLTGAPADAVKAASPLIADSFREMIQNAGMEYDPRFAVVNLLDDADNEVEARPGNISDGELLVDLARDALTAGAIPILDQKALSCIRNLSTSATAKEPLKTYAKHILEIDKLVYGSGPRLTYDAVSDQLVADGIKKFKELFAIGKPRVITTVERSLPEEKFTEIDLTDATTGKVIAIEVNNLDHGKELVATAIEALKTGAIPILSDEQLECIINLQKKGDAKAQEDASKILAIDELVYGKPGARVEQKDVTTENFEAGLQKALEGKLVTQAILSRRIPGPERRRTLLPNPKPPAAPKTQVSLTHEEEEMVRQAIIRKGVSSPDVDLEMHIKLVIEAFNKNLNSPGVTKENRVDVIKYCCEQANIDDITIPTAAPPEEEVEVENVDPAVLTAEEKDIIRKNITGAGIENPDSKIGEIETELKKAIAGGTDRAKFFRDVTSVLFHRNNPNNVTNILKTPPGKVAPPAGLNLGGGIPTGGPIDLSKYARMLKAGLPEGAVKQAMKKDNASQFANEHESEFVKIMLENGVKFAQIQGFFADNEKIAQAEDEAALKKHLGI